MEFNFLEEILRHESTNPNGIALVVGENRYTYRSIVGCAKDISFLLKNYFVYLYK